MSEELENDLLARAAAHIEKAQHEADQIPPYFHSQKAMAFAALAEAEALLGDIYHDHRMDEEVQYPPQNAGWVDEVQQMKDLAEMEYRVANAERAAWLRTAKPVSSKDEETADE